MLYLDKCHSSNPVEKTAEEVPRLQVETACCPHSPHDLSLSKIFSLVLCPANYFFFKFVHFNTSK